MTRNEALQILSTVDGQFLKAEVFGFKKFMSSRPVWGLDWESLPTQKIRLDMLQLWHNSLNRVKIVSLIEDSTFTPSSCKPLHIFKNKNGFGVADGNHRAAALRLLDYKIVNCKIYDAASMEGKRAVS